MLADTSRVSEHPAEVVNGQSHFARNRIQRQSLLPMLAENLLDGMNNLSRVSAGSGFPRPPVNSRDHLVEQGHHCLFEFQWFLVRCPGHTIKYSPLGQVTRRLGKPPREAEWVLWTIVHRRIVRANNVSGDIGADAEPIAAVAFFADRVSQVGLPLVVEGHDVRVRHERAFMLMLNLHGCARKHEAERRRRSRVVKARMIGMAAERPHLDGLRLKKCQIEFPVQRRAS